MSVDLRSKQRYVVNLPQYNHSILPNALVMYLPGSHKVDCTLYMGHCNSIPS